MFGKGLGISRWCLFLFRQVSSRIREDLLQRAGEFNLKLEDVSITHLSFGKVKLSYNL